MASEHIPIRRNRQLAAEERPLTERQIAFLRFLIDYTETNGHPPTLREIGKHFGVRSTNAITCVLRVMARKGYIANRQMKSRGLRVLKNPDGSYYGTVGVVFHKSLDALLQELRITTDPVDRARLRNVLHFALTKIVGAGISL